jgi:hypothetical protein
VSSRSSSAAVKWARFAAACPVLDGAPAREFGVSGEGRRGPGYQVVHLVNKDYLQADCVWGDLGAGAPVVEVKATFNPYQEATDTSWKAFRSLEQVPGLGDDARVFPSVPPAGYRLDVLVDNVLLEVTVDVAERPGESSDQQWRRFRELKPTAVGIAQDAIGDLRGNR